MQTYYTKSRLTTEEQMLLALCAELQFKLVKQKRTERKTAKIINHNTSQCNMYNS